MGKFTAISQDTFKELQFDAGVLLSDFNPTTPGELDDSKIICATTGGINASCVATHTDLGEDIDNCPNGTMELMQIDSYECKLGFTALNMTPEVIKLSIGSADIVSGKVTPRHTLAQTDFKDIWWVGDIIGGGFAAVKLENALSDSGLTIQTTKKGKGNLSVSLTGHYSISNIEKVPMEFYITASE